MGVTVGEETIRRIIEESAEKVVRKLLDEINQVCSTHLIYLNTFD